MSRRSLRYYIVEDHTAVGAASPTPIKKTEELQDPIAFGTNIEVTVRSLVKSGNEVILTFNVGYVSAKTRRDEENAFSYTVALSNPSAQSVETEVGVGTYKGSCFRLIEPGT